MSCHSSLRQHIHIWRPVTHQWSFPPTHSHSHTCRDPSAMLLPEALSVCVCPHMTLLPLFLLTLYTPLLTAADTAAATSATSAPPSSSLDPPPPCCCCPGVAVPALPPLGAEGAGGSRGWKVLLSTAGSRPCVCGGQAEVVLVERDQVLNATWMCKARQDCVAGRRSSRECQCRGALLLD